MSSSNLKLIIMPNIEKFGKLVSEKLKVNKEGIDSNIVEIKLDRFSNGEGKATLVDSVRGKDVFLLSDVGNYGDESSYISRGKTYIKSPDDHYQDIKRVISAMNGKENSLHVVMPLLYQSRQDKRRKCESLDCSSALRELEALGVDGIITYDVHNPSVENALANCSFDNLYPTYSILKEFIKKEDCDFNNLLVVAPDTGAMDRAVYYSNALGNLGVGVFYKRRDFEHVENGKNPITQHIFLGKSVKGKDLLIVDDMIASGSSILDVAKDMKERGASKIYLIATFALFTEGEKSIKAFDEAYENGNFTRLYTTNVTYVPEYIKEKDWYHEVDCSKHLSKIIEAIDNKKSTRPYQDGNKKELLSKIKEKKKVKKK